MLGGYGTGCPEAGWVSVASFFGTTGQVYTGDTRDDSCPFDYHFKENHPLKKHAINYKL